MLKPYQTHPRCDNLTLEMDFVHSTRWTCHSSHITLVGEGEGGAN